MERVLIFDTTLRDGEQSPGCRMDVGSKILVAQQLARLRVDIIEAGFPIASEGDFAAVSQTAQLVSGPTICALARTKKEDIEKAAKALEEAKQPPRIHTFVATSDVHMERKLHKTPAQVLAMAVEAVQLARKYVDDVEFSPEDSARTGFEFLVQIVEAAIQAGATVVNIPDTVGYSVGGEYAQMITNLKVRVFDGHPEIIISAHCHNDLGQAVANTLAGIQAGVRQAECCVLGIGERAGNAQLESIVMALKTRSDQYGVAVGIDSRELGRTARLVSSVIGKPIPDNLPVVGANAFAHGAGIHFDGIAKDRRTYEIMKLEDVGWEGESAPLVKHSGRHALRKRLEALGYKIEGDLLEAIYHKFTVLADTKTYVYNDDLYLLVQETLAERQVETHHLIKVERVDYHRVGDRLSATVALSQNNDIFEASGSGNGPASSVWDAIIKALGRKQILPVSLALGAFNVGKGTGGVEAVGLVTIRVESDGNTGYGRASDTDIVLAFAKAMVAAINHLCQVPVKIME